MTEKDVEDVQQGLEAVHIASSEVRRLQEKQRAAVQRAVRERPRADSEDDSPRSPIHPDLQDLSFGELGPEQRYAGSVCLASSQPFHMVTGIYHRQSGQTRGHHAKKPNTVAPRFLILAITNLRMRGRTKLQDSRRARKRANRL